ncbi:DUF4405 domain-containing protein [Alcanivorax sp. 1008]|uniref:DUF4405 domain-containing protein n=1 Tax=Alcanivorax sp. 1008 TaxID=2816853 RepID=UPI001D437315|nr:DUF4405 domain-containing protein [Alcanivorax sp. 1008]
MFRKIIALSLFVSFIAMATSGMMMFFIEKPSFTIQMHPVHKLFGLIMIVSVIGHLSFNFRAITSYVKNRWVAAFGAVMIMLLVGLYGVAINNEVPPGIAVPMDKLAADAESHK